MVGEMKTQLAEMFSYFWIWMMSVKARRRRQLKGGCDFAVSSPSSFPDPKASAIWHERERERAHEMHFQMGLEWCQNGKMK